MIVLTRLAPPAVAKVRRALQQSDLVLATSSWGEFESAVANVAADVAVADACLVDSDGPTLAGGSRAADVLDHPHAIPLVLYTAVTAQALRIVATARWHPAALLLVGLDDSPERVRRALEGAASATVIERVLCEVAGVLQRLPPAVADAIRDLFRHPEDFRQIDMLARRAGITRRSLDRWLARAEMTSAHVLLASARVTTAYLLLSNRARVGPAASALGYASAQGLRRDVAVVTGGKLVGIRRQATCVGAFVDCVVNRVSNVCQAADSDHVLRGLAGAGATGRVTRARLQDESLLLARLTDTAPSTAD